MSERSADPRRRARSGVMRCALAEQDYWPSRSDAAAGGRVDGGPRVLPLMLRAAEEAADGRVRREISPVPFHARLALTRPGHPAVRLQLRAAGTRFGQRHADPLTCRSCFGRHRGKPRSPLAHVAEAAEQSGQAVGLGKHELVAGDAWLGSQRMLVQLLQTTLRPRELQPEPTAGGTRPDPAPDEGDLAGGSEID